MSDAVLEELVQGLSKDTGRRDYIFPAGDKATPNGGSWHTPPQKGHGGGAAADLEDAVAELENALKAEIEAREAASSLLPTPNGAGHTGGHASAQLAGEKGRVDAALNYFLSSSVTAPAFSPSEGGAKGGGGDAARVAELEGALRILRETAEAELVAKHERIAELEAALHRAHGDAAISQEELATERTRARRAESECQQAKEECERLREEAQVLREEGRSLQGANFSLQGMLRELQGTEEGGGVGGGYAAPAGHGSATFPMSQVSRGHMGGSSALRDAAREAGGRFTGNESLALSNAVACIKHLMELLGSLGATEEQVASSWLITQGLLDVATPYGTPEGDARRDGSATAALNALVGRGGGMGVLDACKAIALVSATSFGREKLVNLGAARPLAGLLASHSDVVVVRWALLGLGSLTLLAEVRKTLLVLESEGARLIQGVVDAIVRADEGACCYGCLVIGNLAVESAWRRKLVAENGVIQALGSLLVMESVRVQRHCAGAFRNLAVDIEAREVMTRDASIPAMLSRCLDSQDSITAAHARCAMENLELIPKDAGDAAPSGGDP